MWEILIGVIIWFISFHVSQVLLLLKIDVYDKDGPFTEDDYVDSLQVTISIQAGKQQFSVYGRRRKDKTR